jgi:AcrR family transcriptional regulator
MMEAQKRRGRKAEASAEQIKAIARAQMADSGTAALSLRAIAREMDMTAPALYRYFPSLDDLITALILDAFNAHADAMANAAAQRSADDYAGKLWNALLAYRQWAMDHRVDFQLIYGNPIPGYSAPANLTVPAASRAFVLVVSALEGALRSGMLHPASEYEAMPAPVLERLELINQRDGYVVPPVILAIASRGWTHIHGVVMLEMFGHLVPVVGDVDAFYRFELTSLFHSMGLTPPE